jgi:hypothetical protein
LASRLAIFLRAAGCFFICIGLLNWYNRPTARSGQGGSSFLTFF